MKRGWVLTIVLIILAMGIGYFIITKTSKYPSDQTQKEAAKIFKYPNSSSWILSFPRAICTFTTYNCQASANISFESQDDWTTIFGYYRSYMSGYGWSSQTTVYTSVPSSEVFTNDKNCQAVLKPTSSNLYNIGNQTTSHFFTFSVYCP